MNNQKTMSNLQTSPPITRELMSERETILSILEKIFDKRKSESLIDYFSGLRQKQEEGDYEGSLLKSGKFLEVTIKLLWIFSGRKLPKEKKFNVGAYAKKIIDEIKPNELPNDELRLQIPRACIFIYDVISNRGGRHHSDKFDPNEMDAFIASATCSWVLAEFVRFCAPDDFSPDEAKEIVDSIIEKRYPIFEDIDGRIYVNGKHKSATECALMVLYKKPSERMNRKDLVEAVKRNGYGEKSLKFSRLAPFIDSDDSGSVFLRVPGRRKVEQILLR